MVKSWLFCIYLFGGMFFIGFVICDDSNQLTLAGRNVKVSADTYHCVVTDVSRNPHNGQCTVTYVNGDIYVGEIQNRKRLGFGRMNYTSSGEYYEGTWLENMKHGEGILHAPFHEYYNGTFLQDMKHGYGILQYANNSGRYEGEFYHNNMQGKGRMYYKNGDYYEGHFVDGVKHGEGYFQWAGGNNYRGDFEDNFMHGHGTYTYTEERSVYRGVFEYDLRTREGSQTYANGEQYVGEWNQDMYNGYGTYYYQSGDVYEGQWWDNQMHGEGIYTWNKTPLRRPTLALPSSFAAGTNRHDSHQMQLSNDPSAEYSTTLFEINGNLFALQQLMNLPDNANIVDELQKMMFSDFHKTQAAGAESEGTAAYIGTFKQGVKHGIGILKYPNSGIEFIVDYSKGELFSNSIVHYTSTHSTSSLREKKIRAKKKKPLK